jgi:AcrR family transcriptional regulator
MATAKPSGIAKRRANAKSEPNLAYLERRQQLVRAAAKVFKEKGLTGTRLQDIAEATGTDRATLYYYVGSKEELFSEVVSEVAVANLERAREIRSGSGSIPEKLRSLMVSLTTSYEEHYPIVYVLIQENFSHLDGKKTKWARSMRQVNKEYEEIVIELIQRGYDDDSLREIAPAWVVAFGLMGMMGWTSRWFNPSKSPVDSYEIAQAFADMALNGLVSDE